ncbi:hypothetical protein SDC9_126263 [bioreactor metagenome]|uniref:Uncharacterized protein n=1 Tax=bioreactor metagenome TaxID=1076179 RepID=A0A645CQ58_9ZZZZ
MVAKVGKAQRDEPDNHGTRGVDNGIIDVFLVHIAARIFRDDLRRAGNLKHIVKSDVQEPLQHIIHVVQIHKLPIERGRGQRDAEFLCADILKAIECRLFRLIGAAANALAAVDADIRIDHRVAIANADGFGRAPFQAVGAAFAFFDVKRNRMLVLIHGR